MPQLAASPTQPQSALPPYAQTQSTQPQYVETGNVTVSYTPPPGVNNPPPVVPQARREVWAPNVISGTPVTAQAPLAPLVQKASYRAQQPAEEVPAPTHGGSAGNAGGSPLFEDDIKPLSATRTNLQPPPGEMPTDYAEAQFEMLPPVVGGGWEDRRQTGIVYQWDAPALCYQPIYFDDVNLERYGYDHGVLEPFVSAVHFFGTIPLLPYKVGMHPERECIYTLGFYRPGTPCPYQTSRLGWSLRAPFTKPAPSARSSPGFPRASSIERCEA